MKKENIRWIWEKLKGYRVHLFVLSILVILSAVCSLLIAYVLKEFVDVATHESQSTIGDTVIFAVLVVIASGAIGIICSVLSARIQTETEKKIKSLIIKKYFRSDLSKIENMHSGEVLTRLTEDVNDVSTLFPNLATKMLGNASVAIFAIISLFLLNVKVALMIVITIPLLISIISLFNFPIGKADENKKAMEDSNRVLMQEYINKVKTIKIFGAQDRFISIFIDNYKRLANKKIVFSAWEGLATFCNKLIGNAMILITLGYGSYLVIQNETSLGSLIAMVQLLNYIINPFSQVSEQISAIAKARVSVDRIVGITNYEEKSEVVRNSDGTDDFKSLIMKNVSFAYSDKEILNNINLEFKKDKVYCIQGDNGIGKSTLLNILAGLYKPNSGDVYFLGINNEKISSDDNPCISLVPADETLFNGTIRDNITLFNRHTNEEKLAEIVKISNLQSVLDSTKKGYDTLISENGKSVSSGQAQQITICRSLYHNAKILLLDEPTSNLDKDSVAIFRNMLTNLKKDRIVIIVSHDNNILDCCDYIYKIEEGAVVCA